jgi:hypothetical protein
MNRKLFNSLIITLIFPVLISSCSKHNHDDINTLPVRSLSVIINAYSASIIDPELIIGSSAKYQWSMTEAPSELYSLTGVREERATLLTYTTGTFHLKLTAEIDNKPYIRNITVNVKNPDKTPSPYITQVYDFSPAPGQFVNKLPEYENGNTKADIISKVKEYIAGKKSGALISLGGFGGSIVVGFDHTIVNIKGKRDFRIMGNAFYADNNPNLGFPRGGSCEPGIVMVAYDANKNGVPDEDEWYEIAGSEYYSTTTIKNYEITYFRPNRETPLDEENNNYSTIKEYIRWQDNQGNSGYKEKNKFHPQSYFPGWISSNTITFRGSLLPSNGVDESGDGSYWVLYAYGYGYADNVPNNEDDSAIDISWAVNSKGERVELPGIDFIRIYTAINQQAGWLGEVSTEISGIYDLHMAGESVKSH